MSVAVRTPGREGYQVYAASATEARLQDSPAEPLPAIAGLVARCAAENRILRVADLRESGDPSLDFLVKAGIRSSLNIPVSCRGEVVGTLNFGSRDVGVFGDIPEQLLREIGAQIAVAVENSRIRSATANAASLNAALVAAITDPVIFTDPDGRILRVNGAFLELSGHGAADLVGRNWMEMARPDDVEDARGLHRAVLTEGSVRRWPMTGRRRDGSPVAIEVSSGLVRDPDGHPLQIISIIREVLRDARAAAPGPAGGAV
jgi:PAS domain S-box-containing protein